MGVWAGAASGEGAGDWAAAESERPRRTAVVDFMDFKVRRTPGALLAADPWLGYLMGERSGRAQAGASSFGWRARAYRVGQECKRRGGGRLAAASLGGDQAVSARRRARG